jgi:hypothetical protein
MTPACDRFASEEMGAALGEPLSPEYWAHLPACPGCSQRRLAYRRVVERLRQGRPGEDVPPAGWQAEVMARIAGGRAPPRRRFRPAALAVSLAVAVACVLLLIVGRPSPAPEDLLVEVAILPDPSSHHRGLSSAGSNQATAGDRLEIRFAKGDLPSCEVRVYRASELAFRCPGPDGCEMRRRDARALVPLAMPGRYTPLLIWSRRPLPAPASGGLADDVDRLLGAGAVVRTLDPVTVR